VQTYESKPFETCPNESDFLAFTSGSSQNEWFKGDDSSINIIMPNLGKPGQIATKTQRKLFVKIHLRAFVAKMFCLKKHKICNN